MVQIGILLLVVMMPLASLLVAAVISLPTVEHMRASIIFPMFIRMRLASPFASRDAGHIVGG